MNAQTDPPKLITAEELLLMPEETCRYELIRGKLRSDPFGGVLHGATVARVASCLFRVTKEEKLGVGMVRCGFVLARNPDTVRAPDLTLVVSERREMVARDPEFYGEGAPDLAVDVRDANDPDEPVEERMDDLLGAGTRLAWIVDPKARTVVVRTPGQPPRSLGTADVLDGSDILPDFRLPVAELFRG